MEEYENEQPKKRRGRPPGSKDKKKRKSAYTEKKKQALVDEMEFNERNIRFRIAITPPTRADSKDIPEMRERFSNYLEKCIEYGFSPGNANAYYAIGINQQTAYAWEHGHARQELKDFILQVKDFCAASREQMMIEGKMNPVVGIFHQKNYDGFVDQKEHVFTTNNALGDTANEEELKKRYLENSEVAVIELNQKTGEIVVEHEYKKNR